MVLQVLIDQTVHHKDAVVDTNTEDKGGNDDADEIELYTEQVHDAQHDEPAEQDGCKAQHRVLDVETERQEQHDEDKSHGQPLQGVEILAHLNQRVCRIIIGIEHEQVGIAADGITDTDIVAVAAAHRVVLAADRGKHQIVATI